MKWSSKELAILRRDYPHMRTDALAKRMGRSISSVYNTAFLLGIKKTPEHLASEDSGRLTKMSRVGRAFCFPKGHQPWNKDRRWFAGGRSAETRFKRGAMPQTWRPIGSERTDKDGILWRKVTDTRRKSDWKAVHVLAWEAVNGPLPRGKFVVFADRNQRNFDPENLLAVTRAENMLRNTVHRYPKEIQRLVQLRGALNRQINKRERHAE